ncbi:RND transporter [Cellvibrio mixtus]|uniref:RND transporter n=1 Tax=Cellvibrio mixtus TaxID=39650 RepID=A0A266QAL7_9GAMM|nr:HlyD family efflux transporter periplasmic adaptor subunit [Cellvibrio mixtus]OZY86389.1 RND transporter [Cellvibrio mixtus]
MDVIKTKSTTNPVFQRQKLAIASIAVFLALASLWLFQEAGSISVSRDQIMVDKVHKGKLDVLIEGYGNLRSDKLQLLSALTRATVKEILLYPGDIVTADSVIARLENTELQREVENAQQALEQAMANLRQLRLNQKTELLVDSERMEEVAASYEKVRLKRIAYEKLKEMGVVPGIKYLEIVVDEQQWAKRKEILAEQMIQLALIHKEAVNIESERIKQQEGLLNSAYARLQSLEVKAGMDGVLQQLSIELGQSLEIGQQIALVGSSTELVAIIRVPQNQAQVVEVGQKVIISTRMDKIEGTVSRIDPGVEENTVKVEVSLPSQLPQSARPQLNVDATIIADTLEQVTYIKCPAKVRSNSDASLYRLDEDQKYASIQTIKFGRRAGDYIEVIAGADVNDRFIISDLSSLKNNPSKLKIVF